MNDDRIGLQVGEIADRIAKADLSAPANYRARQIRSYAQAGILKPVRYRGSGRTAAAEFDINSLSAAALFCALADDGHDIKVLREAAIWMAAPARKKWPPNKVHPSEGLPAMVAGLHAGEDWEFILHRELSVDGKREFHGWFEHISPDTPPVSTRLVKRANAARGARRISTITLHCRGILAPLLGLPLLSGED